jgi:two-component system, OmpR family, phosphate regulon sensor histidine kinase PhoR
MRFNRLNTLIALGIVAIAGILVVQLFLLKQAVSQEEKKFRQKANVALMEVVKRIYGRQQLPQLNPVKEVSEDYYIVNVNHEFNASVLEYYLKTEFTKLALHTDFEYAMYNCVSDSMVYGNYVSFSGDEDKVSTMQYFPPEKDMVYYFAVHFPEKKMAIYTSLWLWIVFSIVMFFVLIIYTWSAFTILQQKKYSELQKDFINNMTHEFKTPLSSILLSANFLSKQQSITADEKMSKYAGLIIQQANRLNNHVEKVLGLAKTEGELFKMNLVQVQVPDSIRAEADIIQIKHPETVIEIINNWPQPTLQADAFHFSNMVHNLLDNAVKYAKDTPHICITLQQLHNAREIIFADKGIGMPAKHTRHIFERFYRIPGRQQNERTGFGLGLFYVKKICTAHGWHVRAESEEGEGTRIIITIPK